ncbi:MAG: DUF4160 domain-containing protein [Atopobiaceae bacterium]|nr:DUF4160 domain-containing protein [Atopobiaceae bacterium]
MPVLARFYGMVIRMYFQQAEHNPPHVHVIYGEDTAAITIKEGDLLDGRLPSKALSMACEWVAMNRDELLDMWETQEFRELSPLE